MLVSLIRLDKVIHLDKEYSDMRWAIIIAILLFAVNVGYLWTSLSLDELQCLESQLGTTDCD